MRNGKIGDSKLEIGDRKQKLDADEDDDTWKGFTQAGWSVSIFSDSGES